MGLVDDVKAAWAKFRLLGFDAKYWGALDDLGAVIEALPRESAGLDRGKIISRLNMYFESAKMVCEEPGVSKNFWWKSSGEQAAITILLEDIDRGDFDFSQPDDSAKVREFDEWITERMSYPKTIAAQTDITFHVIETLERIQREFRERFNITGETK